MTKKISKVQVKSYRILSKIAMVLQKALDAIDIKKSAIEAEFLASVDEHGSQICDRMIAEIKFTRGRTSTEYKAAYNFVYELLSPKKQAEAAEFLASVTNSPKSNPILVVTCSELTFFENQLMEKRIIPIIECVEKFINKEMGGRRNS